MIIPITVDGKEKMYETNASFGTAYLAFNKSDTFEDFVDILVDEGYFVKEHTFDMKLNFDEK